MEFIIRNEQPQDGDQVLTILRSTFPTVAESNLVDALRANGKAVISLVAGTGEGVLGHILFSPVTTTPPHEATGVGLAPVAVRPDVQAKGMGSKLVQEGLRRCKRLGIDYCVILRNPKYYERFGFPRASDDGIKNEYRVDQEFMWVPLSKFAMHLSLPCFLFK
jgi:putative acetyltransferase